MKLHYLIFTGLLLVLISCNKTNLKDMSGTWESVDWYIVQSGEPVDRNLSFVFDTTGRYTVDYGSVQEEGEYWISYDKLFTKEEGQKEKSVRIQRIEDDTMVLEMNRSGQLEILVIARQD